MKNQKNINYWFWFFFLMFCVVGLLFLNFAWLSQNADKGALGDLFGVSNALFSGLAFVGLVIAILQQHEEIKLNKRETDETINTFKKQLKIMSVSARLQALPELIEQESSYLVGLSKKYTETANDYQYVNKASPQDVRKQIEMDRGFLKEFERLQKEEFPIKISGYMYGYDKALEKKNIKEEAMPILERILKYKTNALKFCNELEDF